MADCKIFFRKGQRFCEKTASFSPPRGMLKSEGGESMPHKKTTAKSNTPPTTQSPAFDPQGSYTGRPADGGRPVQDADDL